MVISWLTSHEKLFKPFLRQLFIVKVQMLFINIHNSLMDGLLSISIIVNSEIIINYSLINYFINEGLSSNVAHLPLVVRKCHFDDSLMH